MSCQPCGCDPEAPHECERHRSQREAREAFQPIVDTLGEFKAVVEIILDNSDVLDHGQIVHALSALARHLPKKT